jgi:hypothetical protein
MGNTVTNKVNKVNSNTVKVTINQVKPQVTYIKRLISKHLKSNNLQHSNNTPTKPQVKQGLTQTQLNGVQKVIKNGLNSLKTKYPHTTQPQLNYIKNHLNTHTVKYLQ